MYRISCPKCGHRLKYTNEHIGKVAKCQHCAHRFQLPSPPSSGGGSPSDLQGQGRDQPLEETEAGPPKHTGPADYSEPPKPAAEAAGSPGGRKPGELKETPRRPANRDARDSSDVTKPDKGEDRAREGPGPAQLRALHGRRLPSGRWLVLIVCGAMGFATIGFWPYGLLNPDCEETSIPISERAVPIACDHTEYRATRFGQIGLAWLASVGVLLAVCCRRRPSAPGGNGNARLATWRIVLSGCFLLGFVGVLVYTLVRDPYQTRPREVVRVPRIDLSTELRELNIRTVDEWQSRTERPFIMDPTLDPRTDSRVALRLETDSGNRFVLPAHLVDRNFTLPKIQVVVSRSSPGVPAKFVNITLVNNVPVTESRISHTVDSYWNHEHRSDHPLVRRSVDHYSGARLVRTTTHLIPNAEASDRTLYTLYFSKGRLEVVANDDVCYVLDDPTLSPQQGNNPPPIPPQGPRQ